MDKFLIKKKFINLICQERRKNCIKCAIKTTKKKKKVKDKPGDKE